MSETMICERKFRPVGALPLSAPPTQTCAVYFPASWFFSTSFRMRRTSIKVSPVVMATPAPKSSMYASATVNIDLAPLRNVKVVGGTANLGCFTLPTVPRGMTSLSPRERRV